VEALLATVALAAVALAAAGTLAHFLRFPPALGYLVAGLGLAPTLWSGGWIPLHEVEAIAEVGVLFLLFLIGLELDLKKLRETLRASAVALPFDLLAPMVLVGLVGRWFGWTWPQSIALGITAALSSTLLGESLAVGIKPAARHRVLGTLVAQDVAAGLLLALLAIVGAGSSGFGAAFTDTLQLIFLLLLLASGALLIVPKLLDEIARTHNHELVVLWSSAVIVLAGYVGYLAGSAELGAFLVGVAAAEAGSRYVARNAIQGFRDVAIAIFFFSSGLQTDILALPWLTVAAIAGAFMLAKIFVHAPAAFLAGQDRVSSFHVAFALATMGEFSLVLATVAEEHGIAHPDLRASLVGAMLILLPVAALLKNRSESFGNALLKLPEPIRLRMRSLQRTKPRRKGATWPAALTRRLVSNAVLLAAWLAIAAYGSSWLRPQVTWSNLIFAIAQWSITFIVAAPMAWSAYRAYRELVMRVFGLRPGEQMGAGQVRIRIADAVAASLVLAVALVVVLRNPSTWPILLGAGILTALALRLAWTRLQSFHKTLEESISRILGQPTPDAHLLSQLLSAYPWGMRSAAIPVTRDSRCAFKTIKESRITDLSECFIATVQRRGKEHVNPEGDFKFLPGDTVVLFGDDHQIARAEALLVSHGEALRMTAQSHAATLQEWTVPKENSWIGRAYGDLHLEGAPIVGVWPAHFAHVRRFDPARVVGDGDRIILLGTKLQLDRAIERLEAPSGDPQP
jgi:Kef-type K+ transport system membrane component KefB/K+/H+ antiporter YhaU regulatory subunit KhtT